MTDRGSRGRRPPRPPVPPARRVERAVREPAARDSAAHEPAARAPAARGPASRGHDAADAAREVRLYGINACLAFVANRRDRIIRAWFSEPVARRHFGGLMKWMASARLGYHFVTDDELDRITGSTHHEGICLLVRAEEPLSVAQWLREARLPASCCVLALENVGNPHNLGAILRIAAHFGVPAVMVPDARAPGSGAAVRTAEGGAEFVEVLDAPDFAAGVRAFRAAGWSVASTSSHGGEDVFRANWPSRCLLLLGEESAGLSEPMQSSADLRLCIPGTGRVESLNVSVATGILLGEWWRARGPRSPR